MKITFLIIFFVLIAHVLARQNCNPDGYFWRPFNGKLPNDAFVAKVDANQKKHFIAKIVTPDSNNAVIPVSWKENDDHINIPWCCNTDVFMSVNKFVEILCVETSNALQWKNVSEGVRQCCPLQGGIGWTTIGNYRSAAHKWFIAKEIKSGKSQIGKASVDEGPVVQLDETPIAQSSGFKPVNVVENLRLRPEGHIFASMEIEEKEGTKYYNSEDIELLVYNC